MRLWLQRVLVVSLAVLVMLPMLSYAQRFMQRSRNIIDGDVAADADGAEFHFARLIYSGDGMSDRFAGRGMSWTTDWPEAEHFFTEGVRRLSNVDTNAVSLYSGQGGERIKLGDDAMYDYPFLYAVEVGHWQLSADEARILRDYLDRGGFLMVDDFHGSAEWEQFVASLQKVFPDRAIIDTTDQSEVLHVVYDLDTKLQIPGLAALFNGVTYERDGVKPTYRGVYDDKGRMIVAINHNMDLGDAWEHADNPEYPEKFTAMAYRYAVNYLVYAMTH